MFLDVYVRTGRRSNYLKMMLMCPYDLLSPVAWWLYLYHVLKLTHHILLMNILLEKKTQIRSC